MDLFDLPPDLVYTEIKNELRFPFIKGVMTIKETHACRMSLSERKKDNTHDLF